MEKRKLMKYKLVMVIATLLLATTAVPFVSAEPSVKAEKEQNRLQALQTDYELKAKKVQKLIESLPTDSTQSLHDLFLTVWHIISMFIGHNIISLVIARLCCCWFIVPLVVVDNFVGLNISVGGNFAQYYKDCMDYFNVTEIIYTFGALSIFILPFIYCFSFLLAIACVIQNININIEGGLLGRVLEDLEYIYNPDILLEDYKSDNSLTGFKGYMNDFDMKLYFYNTGFAGSALSIPFTMLCYLDYKTYANDKSG